MLTLEEALEQLSLKSFIEISNTFTIWWATPETRIWKVKGSHCTFRDKTFEYKSYDGEPLVDVINKCLEKVLELEKAERELKEL